MGKLLLPHGVLSWLVVLKIVNTSNRFVYSLIEFSYALTEPVLRRIRIVIPIIIGIDFSPVILVVGLIFLRNLVFEMFAPHLF